ncbi:Membrane bound O-acyl transferase, MBOAT [Candidatus Sulfotelmatobacter kueseliae]|uniref:Membrane bound O-acyl transferase, MBOAT n=1 Tax=Candidatus Sulfotelmatobacter kueseliae TaxID=2042962 RepID=A0A2U3KXR2_9BACT|nr:Membrane bound O-acyl transferase, MBOAT [Candidatus Sulfotelmatobacter kueseliae]
MLQSVCYVLLFLVCVLTLAKIRSRVVRQATLLAASYALYLTWTPWFAAILLLSTVGNFLVGRWLRRTPAALPLCLGIFLNLALLSVFKYLPEIAIHSSNSAFQNFSRLALPLGISFWTFQALSYLFDLYREEELDPTFVEFALYLAFFPVTIAGPVCRMPDMLEQFRSEERTVWGDILQGFRRVATGALMMQLAKLLGQGILAGGGIAGGFDRVPQWSGPDVWCLAFGYGLQLFFDFAGYSHIAIGASKALGIIVPENFERPFASTTPSVFWTRWHMSLSFWIRDYVFLPLAILRHEIWWRNLALVIAMAVFGLWHKGSVLFLLWGCYHGVLLVLHRQVQQVERRLNWEPPAIWVPVSWLGTLSLVSLGWILFRARSLAQVGTMLAAITSPATYATHFLSSSLYFLVAALAAGYAIVIMVGRQLERYATDADAPQAGVVAFLARWRWFWIPSLYALALILVLMITLSQQNGGAAQLMYRRF